MYLIFIGGGRSVWADVRDEYRLPIDLQTGALITDTLGNATGQIIHVDDLQLARQAVGLEPISGRHLELLKQISAAERFPEEVGLALLQELGYSSPDKYFGPGGGILRVVA